MSLPDLPAYAADDHHERLTVELVDMTGSVIATVPLPPVLNKDTRAPWILRVKIMHDDGCSRVLQEHPLSVY